MASALTRPRPTCFLEYSLAALGLSLATAFVTWPQAAAFGHSVVSHFDPLFSMWRLGWFAHASANGLPLVHANTFYPEPATLLLSDAVFLQGALAAPAIWAGVPLPLVYNAAMLVGMVSSGLALYYVARLFDVVRPAAFFGAVVFTLAPFRIDHIMHLELQWVAPAIFCFAALHRLIEAPAWRPALALGLLAAAQFLACVYYTVFLIPLLLAVFVAAIPTLARWRATVGYGLVAAIIAAVLSLPVASLYIRQGSSVGPRTAEDLASYSATPLNYLASPADNTLYGFTADWLGSGERRQFPGALALVAAIAGLVSRRRRLVIAAVIVVVIAGALSLGVHAWPYRALYSVWSVLHGLRAPARYGVFVLAGLATLAALGVEVLLDRLRGRVQLQWAVAMLAVLVACIEYHSPQRLLARADQRPPVYEFLRRAPDGVVLELPFSPPLSAEPDPDGRVDYDTDYVYWSTRHWHPIINGYSGYYPPSYAVTRQRLAGFPDEAAMAFLEERQVRYVLLHTLYMLPGEETRTVEQLSSMPNVRPLGTYRDWAGATHVFEIVR